MDYFNKIPAQRNSLALQRCGSVPDVENMYGMLVACRNPQSRGGVLPALKMMRDFMDRALRLTSENLEYHEDTICQVIPGFKYLSESHSVPEFCRISSENAVNGRKFIEEKIANNARYLNQYKIEPHIVALGAGTLGQEMRVLHATQMNTTKETQIKKIKLDLIEKEYSDKTLKMDRRLTTYLGKESSRQEFLKEVATMLIVGLGYNVKLLPTTTNQCTSFYKSLHDLMKGHNLGHLRPTLELRVYENTDEYLNDLHNRLANKEAHISQANIMYDIDYELDPIDIENGESRKQMIQDIQQTTSPNAVHFSIYKNETMQCAFTETNTSIQGVWKEPRVDVLPKNKSFRF